MKFTTLLIPALAGFAAANNAVQTAQSDSGSGCVACVNYCSDPTNDFAFHAVCIIVKCGIEVRGCACASRRGKRG